MRGGGFVEVGEDEDAEEEHEHAEGDEAVFGGEEGPVGGCVALEEGDFGEDERHCCEVLDKCCF